MFPVLSEGDSIIYEYNAEPRIGDLIVFLRDGFLQIHRVIFTLPGGKIFQKADNRLRGSWIKKNQVLGIVSHIIQDNKTTTIYNRTERYKGILTCLFIFSKRMLDKLI